jgi:hypothetical protein
MANSEESMGHWVNLMIADFGMWFEKQFDSTKSDINPHYASPNCQA